MYVQINIAFCREIQFYNEQKCREMRNTMLLCREMQASAVSFYPRCHVSSPLPQLPHAHLSIISPNVHFGRLHISLLHSYIISSWGVSNFHFIKLISIYSTSNTEYIASNAHDKQKYETSNNCHGILLSFQDIAGFLCQWMYTITNADLQKQKYKNRNRDCI